MRFTSLAIGSFISLIGQAASASPARPVSRSAARPPRPPPSAVAGRRAPGAHHAGITWFNWPNAADHRIGLVYLLINFLVLAFLLHRLIIRKLVADNAARREAIKTQVTAAQ